MPFGTLCAMLVHAAGESFYLFDQMAGSLNVKRRASAQDVPETGGSNPSQPANAELAQPVRASDDNQEVGGSNPSLGSISPEHTIAVVLGARNEDRLIRLSRRLAEGMIPHVNVHEPDAPWNNQLMAIGIVPMLKQSVYPYLKDFHILPDDLYRPAQEV